MAEIQARSQPLFSSAKLKMAIAALKAIWVSSDDKTGESEVGGNSRINALLTRLLLCNNQYNLDEK